MKFLDIFLIFSFLGLVLLTLQVPIVWMKNTATFLAIPERSKFCTCRCNREFSIPARVWVCFKGTECSIWKWNLNYFVLNWKHSESFVFRVAASKIMFLALYLFGNATKRLIEIILLTLLLFARSFRDFLVKRGDFRACSCKWKICV